MAVSTLSYETELEFIIRFESAGVKIKKHENHSYNIYKFTS